MTSAGNAHKQEVLLRFGARPGLRLFNNPVGVGFTGQVAGRDSETLTLLHPRQVTFGLCTGSSDLVGWRELVITPAMVGLTVAQIVAWEAKSGAGRLTGPQGNFLRAVHAAGGCAGVVRGAADGEALLRCGPGEAPLAAGTLL